MQQASEQIASQFANASWNKQQWGTVMFNVTLFGADPTGVKDSTDAFQKAVSACTAAGGGTVYIPNGRYLISSQVTITKPILVVGAGYGNDGSNTNGLNTGITTISWNGAPGGTMFYFKSATANNYLFGGGIVDCLINGENLAGVGIRGSSIGYMRFKAEIRKVRQDGLLIDAANGSLSQFNVIEELKFVYGSSVDVANANGLRLSGSTIGVTQNHIMNVEGLYKNGDLVRVESSDNNTFEKIHGFVDAGGTGKTLRLANANGGVAYNNLFVYFSGAVHAETGTFGNRILHFTSEGGSVSAATGAQLHYNVEDYSTSGVFQTHEYAMSDQKDIPVGAMAIMDVATAGIAALQWPCFDLPDAADSRIGLSLPPVYKWNNGTIQKVRIWFTSDTNNTSKQWAIRVRALSVPSGSSSTTPKYDQNLMSPVVDLPYRTQYFDVPVNVAYTKDDFFYLSIMRLGNDVGDTALGKIQILGVTIFYQGTGPYSPGSGPFAVTDPGR